MKQVVAVLCSSLLLATQALAADQAPAMDLTQLGPVLRKPTHEQQTQKEVEAFLKAGDVLEKAGDWDGTLARVDFPLFMATDDLKGVPTGKTYSRDEYTAMMKPGFGTMPKDLKVTHKYSFVVMSDALVGVNDAWTMVQGKTRVSGRNTLLVVQRDGKWKVKSMVEAGWGDMAATPSPATQPAPAK